MSKISWGAKIEEFYRARAPLIVVETSEEERSLATLKQVCQNLGCQLITCDLAEGMSTSAKSLLAGPSAKDPLSLLEQIEKATANGIYVLKDFHEVWNNPQVKRKLRNMAQRFKYVLKTLVVICPNIRLPDELQDEAVILPLPLPNPQELGGVLDDLLRNPKIQLCLDKPGREKLLRSASGLTGSQAQRAFARAIVQDGVLDEQAISIVLQEKRRVIAQTRALEFFDSNESRETVGGLDILKQWAEQRSRAATDEARDFGLPSPKGVALFGISGTGKSLAAKMFANMWQIPLIRLDVGSLFGGIVGESESITRQALRTVEAIAPCIVWIDEIEKALARGDQDGGTSQRVFGSILIWMSEKTAPCFVVATANDITKLPAELLRKGRFDEIFFLDLPNRTERREIFGVHLKKRGRNPNQFNLDLLAQEASGYVGAEIEQAVTDALFVAFNEGKRTLKTEDIVNALKAQVPLAVSQREVVEHLQKWPRDGRARIASSPDVAEENTPPAIATTPFEFRPKNSSRKRPGKSTEEEAVE